MQKLKNQTGQNHNGKENNCHKEQHRACLHSYHHAYKTESVLNLCDCLQWINMLGVGWAGGGAGGSTMGKTSITKVIFVTKKENLSQLCINHLKAACFYFL